MNNDYTEMQEQFFEQLNRKLDKLHERMRIKRAIEAWEHILDRRNSIRKHDSLNDIVLVEYDGRCKDYPTVHRYCIASEATPYIAASYHVDGNIKEPYMSNCCNINIADITMKIKELETKLSSMGE